MKETSLGMLIFEHIHAKLIPPQEIPSGLKDSLEHHSSVLEQTNQGRWGFVAGAFTTLLGAVAGWLFTLIK
jgi:hypothetical protein